MRIIFLLIALFYTCSAQRGQGLRTLVEWKELEYRFPTNADRVQAIRDGLYVHGNGVPIDTDVYYGERNKSKIFVTVPRFITGIPSSLNIITNERGAGGPLLMPYPDYTWHKSHGKDCNGITSVFRVAIDECNRLWVLDTGRIGNVQHCTPQLLIFDLRTDNLIRRYKFPQPQFKTAVSLFVTPTVDVRDPPPYGTCRKTMVYIADITGFGIVVYDFDQNTSWRIENKLMYPTPEFGTFTIAGESFDLMDGIISIVLTPQSPVSNFGQGSNYPGPNYGRPPSSKPPRERFLFFHSLAGETENMVPLSLVDNRTIWLNNPEDRPRDFVTIGRRGTQSGPAAIDSNGNMYFGLVEDIAVASWNIDNVPYMRTNFKLVAQSSKTLQFVGGLKVKRSRINTEELWALSNRFQKVFTGTKNSQEVNFRIVGCNIDELLSGGCRSADYKDNYIFPN